MIYSSTVRTIAAVSVLACIAGSIVVGLHSEPKTPVLAWTSLAAGAVALLVVLATKRSPKRDAVLFMICGMCIGTVAIVVDAESAQSKSVNRL
ncbi:hypothetical protein [Arthrobacter sp. MMS18-M83]|uniref:hypothetical protein n=1 Tax=Arthrobacter sp. MMS18-M83 TaxID=2996261 RepID=UPI00227C8BBA|nr:hypothetical protein [Arthrobacter sp. MMS18-M83]WAH95605.1 hypothetical protein OW521_14230 [Arthrobacter sp. MMS18-M83]